MIKSSLATETYAAYEGNFTYGRSGRKIEAITIHHMAGKLTARQCGSIFQTVGRCGSSHYGIGYNGEIACYVGEENTAWTNSNWDSNCKSVTIETSNSQNGGNWPVSDASLNSLIRLVADIAKRNGLGTLVRGKNITWHSMFANTNCPGPYLMSKLDYIIAEANKINNGGSGPVGNTVNVYYKVKTQKHGWLPEVKNLEDYAGWEGSPITAFMVRVDRGNIWYQAHIKGGQWLSKVSGYDENDYYKGFAGDEKNPIDCIRIYYDTPSDIIKSSGYKKAVYKVNDNAWQYDDEYDKYGENFAGRYGVDAKELRVTIQ